jgi:osmotically-inducible protein OsmY
MAALDTKLSRVPMNMHTSRRLRLAPISLALGGFVAALVACHKDSSTSEVTATAASVALPEAKKPAALPDADISQAIQRHFQDEGVLRAEHVQVAVAQGIASLSGSVSSLLAKERAVRVTETIKGVRSIVDQLAVVPVARTDQQLKADVTSALQHDSASRPYTLGVAAKDGRVTLSGTADSWQQKNLFADIAKTVRGVKALDNAVAVHYAAVRAESEIATDVKHRIANDVWLDGNVLGVTVTGHTVHVSGVVGSVAQKMRAHSDGWVAGVDAVDDGGVIVDWFAQADQRRVTDYPVKSDAEIGQAVRDALRLDPRLKTLLPQVLVQNGAIVLSGTVDSPSARRAAEGDARDTVGVWSVRDEVLVQPAGKPVDADIERGVKRALAEDLMLPDGKSIQVSSAKGKVALKGTIASGFERFDAIEDAASVTGVTEIDDGLIVKRPPAEIKASIEDRLFWDPMVQRERVSVAVAPDGIATLTGTLDSWSEIKASGQDALWGGATRVINVLKLKNHPEVVAR